MKRRQNKKKPRVFKTLPCSFCDNKKVPNYRDYSDLERYLSVRGGILSRVRNGNCAKHQRQLGKAIKQARHLGLIPFVTSSRK